MSWYEWCDYPIIVLLVMYLYLAEIRTNICIEHSIICLSTCAFYSVPVGTNGKTSTVSTPLVLPANTLLESPLPRPPTGDRDDPSPTDIAIAEERLSYLVCKYSLQYCTITMLTTDMFSL